MRRSSLGLAFVVGLSLAYGGACGPGSPPDTTFHNTNVTGTWDLYRTYVGEPERGPDAAVFENVPSGFGVGVTLSCSSFVLPGGHVRFAGEVRGTGIALHDLDGASWVGTVTGATMDGELVESTRAGTWRAQKVSAVRCKTYEVWGSNVGLCSAPDAYYPEQNGYTFLGTGTVTQTFTGAYSYYEVVTRDLNQVQVDAVETNGGTVLSSPCDGNTSHPGTLGSADGAGYVVGAGGAMSSGGFLLFFAPSAATSITVHVVP